MSWFSNLFKKPKVQPEQVIIAEPPPFGNADAFVDLKKLPVGSPDVPAPGLANNKKISEIKLIPPGTLSYAQSRHRAVGEGGYIAPEYDLVEVGVVEDVESWVRQAFYKKIALMNKEGYDFVGKNPQTIQYIETRLAQIARASRISTNQLLRGIGTSLTRMSNAFLIKKRDVSASGGKARKSPEGKTLKPVAAYFPIPAETMRVKLDKQGNIQGWRQEMPDGQWKNYAKEDICHFYIRRKDGFIFGTPDLVPVLDDVRALRNIEETIELLLHKHLFPLFQYIVGTPEQPAGVTEDGRDEIEVVRTEIQYMPAEGGIVTPERHKIEAIGAEGKALKAEGYLDYFKMRVVAGLGISEMDLGVGDTANRGTARVLSRQLIDTVKDIQDTIEEQFFNEVISELLLESTFSFDSLATPNLVKLQYREIDIENRIETEKHAAEMFKANGITYQEFRNALGREPIQVPDDPEDQDPAKYPEWYGTHWKLFGEPELIIRAIDEAWTPQAKAAAEARSLSTTSQQLGQSQKEQQAQEKQKADEDRKTKIAAMKVKPKPAAPKKPAKKTVKNNITDQWLKPVSAYRQVEQDIVAQIITMFDSEVDIDTEAILQSIQTTLFLWANDYARQISFLAASDFIEAFNKNSGYQAHSVFSRIAVARSDISERCVYYMNKLASDLFQATHGAVMRTHADEVSNKTKTISAVRAVFAAHKYRIKFISDTEVKKARSYGKLLGRQHTGIDTFESVPSNDEPCERCQEMASRTYHPDNFTLDNITPYHPGCQCELVPVISVEEE